MRRILLSVICAASLLTAACTTPAPVASSPIILASTYGSSPWNLPVSTLAQHSQSATYAARLFNYANGEGLTDPTRKGQFSTYLRAYSQPIYDARQATGTIPVYRASFGFQGSVAQGDSVPWNDSWQPPAGNDATMFIVDPSTGREWDLWLVQTVNKTACLTWEGIAAGFLIDGRNLCVGQADLIQDASGNPIDYRTYVGGYPTGGAYIQGMAMVTTADEAASGVIPPALNAVGHNPMFGPECTTAQRTTAAAGVSCGFYEHPASRLEWASHPQDCGVNTLQNDATGRSTTVPEGMRFAIHMTDTQINQWLDGRQYTGQLRNTARVFAVAARDYGFIITNTSCWGAGFVTDGMFNPATRTKWMSLGIPDAGDDDLLGGLITADNLWATAASQALVLGSSVSSP